MKQDKWQTGLRTSLSVFFHCSIIVIVIVCIVCLLTTYPPRMEYKFLERTDMEQGLCFSLTYPRACGSVWYIEGAQWPCTTWRKEDKSGTRLTKSGGTCRALRSKTFCSLVILTIGQTFKKK